MTSDEFETFYEAMAEAIDAIAPEYTEVFLAKLCLALGQEIGEGEKALALIADCRKDLARE
ncbi:hypothetical protein [Roseibium aggregatum]|uniref:DUF2783 domain-containing protein n=1 Tax=Roseibium aggregatum TaxID=187304 RepID=A0A926P0V7_9HYPH|nr:hypothetical protein [Roseibium aggregatum]MBD1547906.1 hypothetical protein [Roseibium aggregatum]